MAKLNGVKTLDMVNGEITKVAYDGAEYVNAGKINGQAGDIGLRVRGNFSYATVGEFYPIVLNGSNLAFSEDGAGIPFVCEAAEYFVYFRKVNAEHSPADGYTKISQYDGEVGDFIKFAEDDCFNDTTGGKYYEIISLDSDDDYEFIDDAGDENFAVKGDNDFEVYTLAGEVAKVEAKVESLNVGEYAKVIAHDNICCFGGKTGDVVKIIEVGGDRYKTQELDGGDYKGNPWAQVEGLLPATDEEIAQAKVKQAEIELAAKWAKIGRKPGEFKKGDIVRVVDTLCTNQLTVGQLTEVVSSPVADGSPDVKSNDGGTRYAKVELITPVEARFDR